jgi:hypothetical protein
MSYVFTRIGPHDFLKEEVPDGLTNNSTLVRNVPDHEGPLPLPSWNFEKEKDGQDKKTSVSNGEETALPLPVMF